MNKKQFAVTLALMLVMSFLGGTLAVTLLDSGQVHAAAGKYAIVMSSTPTLAWAINTETGAVRVFMFGSSSSAVLRDFEAKNVVNATPPSGKW